MEHVVKKCSKISLFPKYMAWTWCVCVCVRALVFICKRAPFKG